LSLANPRGTLNAADWKKPLDNEYNGQENYFASLVAGSFFLHLIRGNAGPISAVVPVTPRLSPSIHDAHCPSW